MRSPANSRNLEAHFELYGLFFELGIAIIFLLFFLFFSFLYFLYGKEQFILPKKYLFCSTEEKKKMVSKLREVEYFSLNQAITCLVLLGLTISQVNRFSSILALERGAEQTYLCCLMLSVNYRIRACLGDLLNKAKIVFKSKIRRGVKDRDLHTLKNTLYCFSAIFQHYNFCHECYSSFSSP